MARSLGLSAYRAFTGRGGVPPFTPVAKRPTGELVWCHAPEPGSLFAIQDLAIRLCRSRPGLSVLITVPQALVPVDLPPCSERAAGALRPCGGGRRSVCGVRRGSRT